jgi:hypothetical protein
MWPRTSSVSLKIWLDAEVAPERLSWLLLLGVNRRLRRHIGQQGKVWILKNCGLSPCASEKRSLDLLYQIEARHRERHE